MSTAKTEPKVVRLGDSIISELKGPKRNQRFEVSLDYFWRQKDGGGFEQTEDECLRLRIGARSTLRVEPTVAILDTMIATLEKAKKELL